MIFHEREIALTTSIVADSGNVATAVAFVDRDAAPSSRALSRDLDI